MAEYDRIARYYDVIFAHVFPYDAEAAALDRLFRDYGGRTIRTVLDASCGTGSHLLRLANAGYRCCGSDISPAMLDVAGSKAKRDGVDIEFFVRDIKQLEMDRAFDAVISLYGLPLMLVGDAGHGTLEEELARALGGIYRVLEDKGLLVFNVIDDQSPIPYPGFGPWCSSNVQPVAANGMEIVLMNKLRRNHNLLDFKDVYLVQENGEFSMEILIYSIWLPGMEQLTAILESSGFRVLALYSRLSTFEVFEPQALDVTVVAAKK